MKKLILKNDCNTCSKCCEYVCINIDKPTTMDAIDEIIWILLHENMEIYIDHDGDWFVQVDNKCKMLGPSGECTIYNTRPKVCREHTLDECEGVLSTDYFKHRFTSNKEFVNFIKKNKSLNRIYQRLKKKVNVKNIGFSKK